MKESFTLLELVVVIISLGVLATLGLLNTEEWWKRRAVLKQGRF